LSVAKKRKNENFLSLQRTIFKEGIFPKTTSEDEKYRSNFNRHDDDRNHYRSNNGWPSARELGLNFPVERFSVWIFLYQVPVMTHLCVGPRNSGKTMLLNSIQYPGSVNFTTHSVNTVGTNLFTINYNPSTPPKTRKAVRKSVTVRELGGEMAVMWSSYFTESVEKIMFVVDTSNLCQISCAGE